MFRSIEDFRINWISGSEAISKLYQTLTDASLNQRVTAEGRSLGEIAWHNVTAIGEMLGRTGLQVDSPKEDTAVPVSAVEIFTAYEAAAHSAAEQTCRNWTDASLLEKVNMYGEEWTRGYTLAVLLHHQSHHCGQMTVLMRQAGLQVPGVCGPSREEWAQLGMPPMK